MGSSTAVVDARVARQRIDQGRRREPLAEHGRDAVLLDQLLQPAQVGRGRLGVGGETGDRLEVQAVLLEVAERVVADHHRVPLAALEPGDVVVIEALQVGAQVRGVGREVVGVVGVELGQLVRDRVAEVRHEHGVLPEVRVEVAVVVAILALVLVAALSGQQLDRLGRVEHRTLGVRLDGVVDGRLEAVLEDDEVGTARWSAVSFDGELEVVRLLPGTVRLSTVTRSPPTRVAAYCNG